MNRTLTITLAPDWRASVLGAFHATGAKGYQGEMLGFETPGGFFAKLSERRWAIVNALQGQGEMTFRELARRVGRDVKRVHDDAQVLLELGLVERGDGGGILCPFQEVHIDMRLQAAPLAA